MCELFSQQEASAYVGAPVGKGHDVGALGVAGCIWSDESTGNKISIAVTPAGNALEQKNWGIEWWEGFRSVPGIGSKAYLAARPTVEVKGNRIKDGWQAKAIVSSDYVVVRLRGPNGDADAAVRLLREMAKRLQ